MEVDPEEVKRHLEILGYSQIDPNVLNEFIKDLKKIIEYDRKHNNISALSMSLYKDCDWSYSERMKNSTSIKNPIDHNCTANEDEDEVNPITKHKSQNCDSRISSKNMDMHNTTPMNTNYKYESEFMQSKCYFCGCIPMENQPRLKVKHNSKPLHSLHLSVTFGIEL